MVRSVFFSLADRDVEKKLTEAQANFNKQLRAAQERASGQGLSSERRLREEQELALRLSARNTDLQVHSGVDPPRFHQDFSRGRQAFLGPSLSRPRLSHGHL